MGLLSGPESGLETAYFGQYLLSRCLILHFYIFTWGSALRPRIWTRDSLFWPISALKTSKFTFLHGGLIRGPESGLETADFGQNLDSKHLILYFLAYLMIYNAQILYLSAHFAVCTIDFTLKTKIIKYTL